MTNTQAFFKKYERVVAIYPSNTTPGKTYKVYMLGDRLMCECYAGNKNCRHKRRYINKQKNLKWKGQ